MSKSKAAKTSWGGTGIPRREGLYDTTPFVASPSVSTSVGFFTSFFTFTSFKSTPQ